VSGSTPLFGVPALRSTDRYVDQVGAWKAGGDITRVELFYSYSLGCVFGVKPSYGATGELFGVEDNLEGAQLELHSGEFFTGAEFKAGRTCLEYMSLTTNKGRNVAIGDAASNTMTSAVWVNRRGGYLGALRGYAAADGALQQLQLVWALTDCPHGVQPDGAVPVVADGVAAPARPEAGPTPESYIQTPSIEADADPFELFSEESGPAATPAAEAAPVPAVDFPAPLKEVCPPKPDMCDASAAAGATNFCKAASPFEAAKCVGGCCISSGKCKFGSCVANGLGKDAPLTCFNNNTLPSPLSMIGNKCAHLACKLAIPGCKTALVGGNCVGTVVAVGDASKLHAQGARFVGHPCVETTPTGGFVSMPKALDLGLLPRDYVLAGWKVCDCVDAGALPKPSGFFSGLPKMTVPQFKMPKIPEIPKFGLGGKNATAKVSVDGGDADLMAGPTKFGMMRDLIAGSMSHDKSDPFADFVDAGASGGDAAAALPESGAFAPEGDVDAPLLPESGALAPEEAVGDEFAAAAAVEDDGGAPAPEGAEEAAAVEPEFAAAAAPEEDAASEFDALAN
jgi:hypothetical protein